MPHHLMSGLKQFSNHLLSLKYYSIDILLGFTLKLAFHIKCVCGVWQDGQFCGLKIRLLLMMPLQHEHLRSLMCKPIHNRYHCWSKNLSFGSVVLVNHPDFVLLCKN
jgi:hypothetical protein